MHLIPEEHIEQIVRAYIADRLAGENEEIEVEFRSMPGNLAFHGSSLQLRVDESAIQQLKGPTSVVVEVFDDGRIKTRLVVSCVVRTFAHVLVTTKQINRHASVASDGVRRIRMETTYLRQRLVRDSEALASQRAKRFIAAGSILYEDMFEPVPLVLKGDNVILTVLAGGVRLSTRGVAAEDGWKGDRITVRREGSNVALRGIVEDEQTVAVSVD
jgi:flagella basal body P-ring formation protein FlgA